MLRDPFYRQVFKWLVFIGASMILARYTAGGFCLVLVAIGCFAALSNKSGLAICMYVFLPYLLMFNSALLPKTGVLWGLSTRVGALGVAFALVLGAMRRSGSHRLPFAGLLLYLAVAVVSSASGWAPLISYLKIINFLLFLLGIWLGTQNIQRRAADVLTLRAFFMALVVLTVLGSVAVLPFPSISYGTSLRYYISEGGAAAADAAYREIVASGGQTLFSGVMSHSQALSPVLSMCFAWVLCDMLFVEHRMSKVHVILVIVSVPLLFKTRSRLALLTLTAAFTLVYFYAMRKISVSSRVRQKLRGAMTGFFVMLVVGAVVLEFKDHTMTRWIRKTQDVEGDKRSLSEAFTSSRQGKIDENMDDFYRNPLFGSGFQVASYMQNMRGGLVLSAPIEKGVLPAMVLGETGIVGIVAFTIFLIAFYATSARKNYYVTMTLFAVLLVSNLGEATFFSPGGIGALLWVFAVIGGFVIDTCILFPRQMVEIRRRVMA